MAIFGVLGIASVELSGAATEGTTQAADPAGQAAEAAVPANESFGPAADATLTPQTADPLRATEAGQVIENIDLNGTIWVRADNVTIRNVRITTGGFHAIRVFPEADGTVIENTEISCTNQSRTKGIVFGNYTVRNVEANGCKRPFVGGSDVVVESSLINGRPYSTLDGAPLPAGRAWWCIGNLTTVCGDLGSSWPPPGTPPVTAAPVTTEAPATTATTARPVAPPTTAAPPAPRPSPNGFPGESTTGFNNCGRSVGSLEARSGTITLNDGDVLENFDLNGSINVVGNDVTVRCGRIRSSGRYAISGATSGGTSYLIENVQMVGTATDAEGNSAAIGPYGAYTARNVDVTRFRDGIKLGSNQVVEESWIHDLWMAPGSHSDGMQSVGGTNVTVRNNNIEGNWRGQTSAMIILSDNSQVRDYEITGNRLSGGGYTVYIGAKPDAQTPSNVTLANNVFVNGSATYGALNVRANWPSADSGASVANNVFDSGGNVPVPADCSGCP